MLISTYQLSKTYGARPLFTGLTFTIDEKDRIGLIGPNGAGKSTLLQILSGHITDYDGEISRKQGLTIGYLAQSPVFAKDATIISTILEGADDPDDWQAQSLAQEYISKMGLGIFDHEAQINTLSGGWKKRVALARELVKKPNILLLDEPTNHMDIEGITWLETFLSNVDFAVVTITHDRLFLQRVSNRILEINARHEGGLLNVQGDYMKYTEIRDQLILSQERRETILKNTLRRETAWLKAGVKARTTKQKARIEQVGELKAQVDNLEQRNVDKTARLSFVGAEKLPKRLLEATNLSKQYNNQTLFENLNLTITPGTRIGLLGKNGAGKSSLIRCLLKTEALSSGEVFHADQLKVAYFDQNRDDLDLEQTLSHALCPSGEHVHFNGSMVHIRSYLDRFLFTKQQFDMKVGMLSGGEQSRLLVARLMLEPANLLILDEPTNDLDISTLNVLEQCLQDFPGAIILVTHDRYFLDQISNQLLAFPSEQTLDAKLISFADFAQWEAWQDEQVLTKKKTAKQKAKSSQAPKTKLSYKEQYALDHMQDNIDARETKLATLEKQSTAAENISNPDKLMQITQDMASLKQEIDNLYQLWQELELKQEGQQT